MTAVIPIDLQRAAKERLGFGSTVLTGVHAENLAHPANTRLDSCPLAWGGKRLGTA